MPERLSTSRRWSSASLIAADGLDPEPVRFTQFRNLAIRR